MAVKIRMRQQGRRGRPFFRLVVTDSRSPRDGRYIEAIGWYNPLEQEQDKAFVLKSDRLEHWVEQGAQLSESVEHLAAKAAPEVLQKLKEKKIALRAKQTQKQKARRKTSAAASKKVPAPAAKKTPARATKKAKAAAK